MPVTLPGTGRDVASRTTAANHEIQQIQIDIGTTTTASPVAPGNPLPVVQADAATQTTLAAILAKLITSPATEATLAAVFAKLNGRPGTGTTTRVPSATANTTLLAATVNRLGATVYNDSASILKLKLGATSSATSCTLQMAAGTYYEIPFWYTGIVTGLWISVDGAANVTELTP